MINIPQSARRHADSALRVWLAHISYSVLKRSLAMVLIIGCLLILTSQSSAQFGHKPLHMLTLLLSFANPFVVVTLSQLSAAEQVATEEPTSRLFNRDAGFVSTLLNHDIPARALLIALLLGSVYSVIVLLHQVLQLGQITSAVLPLIALLYVLPFLFGAISQTLTYRRHVVLTAI